MIGQCGTIGLSASECFTFAYINALDVDVPAQVYTSWTSAGVGTQKHPKIHWNVSLSTHLTEENILEHIETLKQWHGMACPHGQKPQKWRRS